MDFRKSRNLMWKGFILAIIIIMIGGAYENLMPYFTFIGIIIFFASLIQAFIFYRCPKCGGSLMDVKGSVPDFCPKCGEKLKNESSSKEI